MKRAIKKRKKEQAMPNIFSRVWETKINYSLCEREREWMNEKKKKIPYSVCVCMGFLVAIAIVLVDIFVVVDNFVRFSPSLPFVCVYVMCILQRSFWL